ncbi:MAG: hypothetical protein ACRBFS_03535 [Aureispira sp.]
MDILIQLKKITKAFLIVHIDTKQKLFFDKETPNLNPLDRYTY